MGDVEEEKRHTQKNGRCFAQNLITLGDLRDLRLKAGRNLMKAMRKKKPQQRRGSRSRGEARRRRSGKEESQT